MVSSSSMVGSSNFASAIDLLSSRILDVKSLVDATVASKSIPLERARKEIERKDLAISNAAVLMNKIADLEDALSDLESTESFATFNELRDSLKVFVETYNSLRRYFLASVKSVGSISADKSEVGSLSGSGSLIGLMDRVSKMIGTGIFDEISLSSGPSLTLRSLGVVLQPDGSLIIGNPQPIYEGLDKLSLAETKDKLLIRYNAILASGMTVGYDGVSSMRLRDFLADNTPLILDEFIADKKSQKIEIESRRDFLQSRLEIVRKTAVRQYSALDMQLSSLQSLNTSISNMLFGFTSFQKSK